MTKRLYELDVYQKSLSTDVVGRIEEEGKKFLLLKETIFFPEGGGQPCDLGTIEGIEVLDVRERGEEVYHQVSSFPENDRIQCQLNWDRRLDHMQQHCGEHILSGVIFKLYGGVNKGFHMGKDMVTIDIDLKEMTPDMILKIEKDSNDVIYRNAPITTEVVHNQEEAEKYPLRKKMTVSSDIRIVQVDDADCVACCGTHPSLAGEVGLIKIYKAEKNKGMTRLHFKCGGRAMLDYRERHDVLTKIMQLYSADLTSIYNKIEKEREKAATSRESLRQIKMSINDTWVSSHIKSTKNIIEIFEDKDMDDMKYLVKKMTDSEFKETLCLGNKLDYGVILVSSTSNCGQIFKDHIKNFNGRGGGSPQMAQGSFQNEADMMAFMNEITLLI
jgi:alanyl-tRNA synthetase